MNYFTEAEIKEIESMEDLKDMVSVLDSILDGETFKIRNTDTDVTVSNELKPVLPKGLITSDKVENLKNKTLYAYVLQVLISLLVELNPINELNEDDYVFRMAIIVNAITSGCIVENSNWVYSDVTFDKDYIKKEGKKVVSKNKDLVSKIKKQLQSAYTFMAFSSMNMVRFNHHFPNDKINLIIKSLSGIPNEQRDRLLEEEKLDTFYNYFVTAARIVNDKKLYEKYILKKKDENNKYLYYQILGAYDLEYEEEIIRIRNINTPNGFLILDIINEIYNDIKNRKLLFAIPYKQELGMLLQIRNHLRANPFGYHPSKGFYHCIAKDYNEVVGSFQNLMKKMGSFVYQYSESMFESVRNAKCRIKYEKNITKDDEVLVKALLGISKIDFTLDEKTIDIAKKKLYVSNIKIDEQSDLEKLNEQSAKEIEELSKKEIKF